MIHIDTSNKLLTFRYNAKSTYFFIGIYDSIGGNILWEIKLKKQFEFNISITDLSDGYYQPYILDGAEGGIVEQKQIRIQQRKIIINNSRHCTPEYSG